MRDKVVLITGATSGVGYHLARDLAVRGATLLLHGRDQARLDAVAGDLRALTPAVRTYLADLADLDQVRALAARVREREHRLDVLVNNAAVGATDPTRRDVSRQGHELLLAVNHLAPYLLTTELLPLLTTSAPARVVNVASMGQAPVDLDDVGFENGPYDAVVAYCRAKLAMIMSTFDLAAEVPSDVLTINAVHPAHLMDTPLVRAGGFTPITTVDAGVLPTLRLVADPALDGVSGRYFDRFDDAPAHQQAYDLTARQRLAAATRALVASR
ncbi:SDR family NAD(P)-dependent oxidoreductase [Micromonospora sp. NPDC023888]|uniref:SDR family NAD(P)-dependent oxidoreductase n=1 Tax=Micromonospora sp. NPDC023888 TaxID=3155607 RepID=UPI0033FE2041